MMRIVLAKEYGSYVMNAQSTTSLYHSVIEKRKMAILLPLQRKNPGRIATFDCPLFNAWTAINHGVFSVQTIFQNATMQTLNNLFSKSGPQEGGEAELSKKSPLGKKQHALFFSRTFFLV